MIDPILSIHIPKTAGTTFKIFLQEQVTNKLFFDYHRRNDKAFYGGKEIDADLDSLLAMPEKGGYTVIHGHYPLSKYIARFKNPTIVTWMRDPVERVASEYFYYKRRNFPTNPLWVKTINQNLTLEQFSALAETRNMQSRYMDAIATEEFDFIGIAEMFDDSMRIFSRRIFHIPMSEGVMCNVNAKRNGKMYALDEDVRKSILSNNIADYAKYQKALELHYSCHDYEGL